MEGFIKRYDIIHYGILSNVIFYYEVTKAALLHPFLRFHEETYRDSQYFERLGRAFSNVADDDARATYSRFAIWGAGLNSLLEQTADAINHSNKAEALRSLDIVQRNIRAYVDCCAMVDSQPGHMQFSRPDEILDEYRENMEETKENADLEKKPLYDQFHSYIKEFQRPKYKNIFRNEY